MTTKNPGTGSACVISTTMHGTCNPQTLVLDTEPYNLSLMPNQKLPSLSKESTQHMEQGHPAVHTCNSSYACREFGAVKYVKHTAHTTLARFMQGRFYQRPWKKAGKWLHPNRLVKQEQSCA